MTCHRTHGREEPGNKNISPICSDMLAFSRRSDFGDSTKRCKRKEQRGGGVGGLLRVADTTIWTPGTGYRYERPDAFLMA